ncbi:class I SAM-dependent methyltransferase [Hyphomonas sp.]|uniref:class I SAM-dependent methyltransferase n=1 Tax=Hyphomonas sp. TaxID=87 RepID=UPI0025C0178B|nr:class I SAM-dependent methyltransferase [Hyphomonas sp.]MBI1401434.1 class I SAM-dependent methyltransferase [Hyphomonas sp.]
MSRVRTITGAHDTATKGEAELYETPPGAVRALLAAEPFFRRAQTILEPCCGPGQMVAALQAEGHQVIAADRFDYEARWKGRPDTVRTWHLDFLTAQPDRSCSAVVMNPPYSRADAFIERALACAPRVYALLELGWLQGEGALRCDLIDGGPLIRVYQFRGRLDMHRDGFPVERRQQQARKHAWFCFVWRSMAEPVPVAFTRVSEIGGGDA